MASNSALHRLSDLEPGQVADFFALLSERSRGETSEGKPYYKCRFRDARHVVSFMVWRDGGWYDTCERDWSAGQFFKIRALYGDHIRFGPQIEVISIRPLQDADRNDGFDLADFVPHSLRDPEEMWRELNGLAESQIADPPLRRLVLALLTRYADGFKRAPATLRNFYPFAGGLLEHTLSVTRTCIPLADHYKNAYPNLQPPLNRDLIVAGAILHDIGRVVEFDQDVVTPQPTVPGRLLGHLFLGRDLIRDAGREQGDVDPGLLELLEHLVISHLNLPEWGSPRLPLIPESLVLHHADDLDAKVEMYARCLIQDRGEGPFTARDPVLGRNLYKGRRV